jgi:D-aminopeptidase
MQRARLRELGISIGTMEPGPNNAITDVDGVLVGHATVIRDAPSMARTGVTVILPRKGEISRDHSLGGFEALNGVGEMTGLLWLEETGLMSAPIALTNTHQVGLVRDILVEHFAPYGGWSYDLPIVSETWDGYLNDIHTFPLERQHVLKAISSAHTGIVEEGNVGGGTGTVCHEFKGGIGTSSRVVQYQGENYIVGALVQANHGSREDLRVNGAPVGKHIGTDAFPPPWSQTVAAGSIVTVLATDAPLSSLQCKRLARRGIIGFARAGGAGHHGSGDLFLAFTTYHHLPAQPQEPMDIRMLPHSHLNPFFQAAAEAVEEAILNSLTSAETMTGYHGRVAHAIPLDQLVEIVNRYSS